MIDTNAYIGGYPFRHIPHPEPAILARVLEREGLDGAWRPVAGTRGTADMRRTSA